MTEHSLKRCLIAGRFQPFHLGHLELVKQAKINFKEIIIVIGSSQFNYLFKDPFTSGERLVMLHDSLIESGFNLSDFYIVPIKNIENNFLWLSNVCSLVPSFSTIYSGNNLIYQLLKDSKINIEKPKFLHKKKLNGTYIRKQILLNKKWEHLVPLAISRIIKEIGGVERIKSLADLDADPMKW